MSRSSLGRQGEELAARFLSKKGLKIVERNVRTPFGELDIVARKGKKLFFVEVKTRRSLDKGMPVEAVSRAKKQKIVKSALFYMNGKDEEFEIGVVSIVEKDGNYEVEYINDIMD